jgi:glycosyltransferase involved in cell wall biosynthesis
MRKEAVLADDLCPERDKKNSPQAITIVICAYTEDRWETLRQAIDAALKQIDSDDELLIVVDHNEGLLARCRSSLSRCIVVPNCYNRGLSGARNTALDEAHGSIVVFLDDDAVPLDGWLEALRAPYADESVYGVGGLARPHWLGGQPEWFPEEFLWVVGCSYRGLPSRSHRVRNLLGANMSFRRTVFDRIGGFSEKLGRVGSRPLGCEETELSIRLAKADPEAILLYDPSAQVEHHITQQRESLSYFVRRCWSEGLSKAEVSRRVGRASALSAERSYAARVLPRGIWRGFRDGLAGDIWGVVRSIVIVLGLVVTATGYWVGIIRKPSGDEAR